MATTIDVNVANQNLGGVPSQVPSNVTTGGISTAVNGSASNPIVGVPANATAGHRIANQVPAGSGLVPNVYV
jgi:hypothetical protein